jgi:hypothetical protein
MGGHHQTVMALSHGSAACLRTCASSSLSAWPPPPVLPSMGTEYA